MWRCATDSRFPNGSCSCAAPEKRESPSIPTGFWLLPPLNAELNRPEKSPASSGRLIAPRRRSKILSFRVVRAPTATQLRTHAFRDAHLDSQICPCAAFLVDSPGRRSPNLTKGNYSPSKGNCQAITVSFHDGVFGRMKVESSSEIVSLAN